MLKNVPKVLSPELLKVLSEMGHSDCICVGDGNFPGSRYAKEGNCVFLRADGIGTPELLDAILSVIPLDEHIEKPFMFMEKAPQDQDLEIPIIEEFAKIIEKYEKNGRAKMGSIERFAFYEKAKSSYCILQSGEEAIYANFIVQKGVIK